MADKRVRSKKYTDVSEQYAYNKCIERINLIKHGDTFFYENLF